MKTNLLTVLLVLALFGSANAFSRDRVHDQASLQKAIAAANADTRIRTIVFAKDAKIALTKPLIYQGTQRLTIYGNGAEIDGSQVGGFVLDKDLTAKSKDATLLFNTAAALTIIKLSVVNSATRGIVVNVPENAETGIVVINLHSVKVTGSALYGLHIDDNSNEFDEGSQGSDAGIELRIFNSSFTANGTGAIDFDGIRVDERGKGGITVFLSHTHIDGNGGDGMELDEAGVGDVDATLLHVTLNDNGFYNAEDLDDGFDIDEADAGDIKVRLRHVEVAANQDEGLDFDEAGPGDVDVDLLRVMASSNKDEGIKIDEENAGDIRSRLLQVRIIDSGDDGLQLTETGEGHIEARLKQVISSGNKKYGVKLEQWFVENEAEPAENAGYLNARKLSLRNNGKGDDVVTHNVTTTLIGSRY